MRHKNNRLRCVSKDAKPEREAMSARLRWIKMTKLNSSSFLRAAASYATRFSAAITRSPAETAVDGLRAEDTVRWILS